MTWFTVEDVSHGRWGNISQKALPRRRPRNTSRWKPSTATKNPTLSGTQSNHDVGTVRRKAPNGIEKPDGREGTYNHSISESTLKVLSPQTHRHTHTHTHTHTQTQPSTATEERLNLKPQPSTRPRIYIHSTGQRKYNGIYESPFIVGTHGQSQQ